MKPYYLFSADLFRAGVCPKCFAVVYSTLNKCGHCKTELDWEKGIYTMSYDMDGKPKYTCSKCGHVSKYETHYCTSCKTEMESAYGVRN